MVNTVEDNGDNGGTMNDIMISHDNNNKVPLLFVFPTGAAPNFLCASNSVQLSVGNKFCAAQPQLK
jgi:hypothetical protein